MPTLQEIDLLSDLGPGAGLQKLSRAGPREKGISTWMMN
jgi:hypothetical protein